MNDSVRTQLLLGLAFLGIRFLVAKWVYRNARERGAQLELALPWAIAVFAFPIMGWLFYLIFRPVPQSAAPPVSVSGLPTLEVLEQRYASATKAIASVAGLYVAGCVFILAAPIVFAPSSWQVHNLAELPRAARSLLWLHQLGQRGDPQQRH